jgi:hypothetical protein
VKKTLTTRGSHTTTRGNHTTIRGKYIPSTTTTTTTTTTTIIAAAAVVVVVVVVVVASADPFLGDAVYSLCVPLWQVATLLHARPANTYAQATSANEDHLGSSCQL